MKRFFNFPFFKLFLSVLCGIGLSSTVYGKAILVGVSIYNLSDKYPTYLKDAIVQFDKQHDDVKFLFSDANSDPAKMLNDIENYLEKGVDALLVMPTDRNIVRAIGKAAKQANVPLIIVNGKPKDKDMSLVTSFVGSDEIKAGILQAEFVVQQLQGKPANALILMGPLGWEAQIKRTAGNEQVLKNHPEIKIVSKQEARWDRANAIKISEDLLKAKGINVVFANNDEMAIGALLAANKKRIPDHQIIIVGIDATPDALSFLGKGLDATVYQSAVGQGKTSAETAYLAAKGIAVPKYQYIDFELVTPDKKQAYLNKYIQ